MCCAVVNVKESLFVVQELSFLAFRPNWGPRSVYMRLVIFYSSHHYGNLFNLSVYLKSFCVFACARP